jgi:copper chaperone NosL
VNTLNEKSTRYLNTRLERPARGLLLAAGILLAAAFFLPMWRIDVASPDGSTGLGLTLYVDRVATVGWAEQGVEVKSDESPDSRWLPFVVGGLALLVLRAAAIGTGRSTVDLVALFTYFAAFSVWSFAGRLDFYGRYFSAATSRGVALFVPPLFGSDRIDGRLVSSFPGAGAIVITMAALLVAAAFAVSWRRCSAELTSEIRMAA